MKKSHAKYNHGIPEFPKISVETTRWVVFSGSFSVGRLQFSEGHLQWVIFGGSFSVGRRWKNQGGNGWIRLKLT
ncbi:hypothetical protein [Calothrix sp. NIES-3974]|uniref:hypothetical protein n=1 Tax=Calothrix sp. NIES-3974 TaxID=2005462 RepID=UPI000BBC3722|nr:hypothetical protein [Calothrix sp. NIES-3974]